MEPIPRFSLAWKSGVAPYSYRTECTYIGWAERFFRYAAERQQLASPHIDAGTVRDYLTHLRSS